MRGVDVQQRKVTSDRTGPDGSSAETETTELAFDVDAALLVELGERLVARRSVALAELIKNAYDADATEAIVSFENVTGPSGSIVVVDDGSGMSLEDMRSAWMRIATNDASVNARSARFGRPRTGAKGVGRFACGRLASRLSLDSVSRNRDGFERVSAEFDWRDFTPGRDLSDITLNVSRETVTGEIPIGTTLRLSELVDTWDDRDIQELQAELGDLMNFDGREGYVQRAQDRDADPGFHAEILAPEFPKHEGAIGDPFLEAAWGVLKGQVADTGQPQYTLHVRDADMQLLHHPRGHSYPRLAGVTFTIRMMVYQGSHFRGTGYNLREARQLGRARGGVRVYLDGFQVFSYGAPGDDWLDLDQHRARRQADLPPWLNEEAKGLGRPMLLLPGNMQLFGSVALSRERNPAIAVNIGRERLVQNEAFDELKEFVRSGIDWMTVCYAREGAASSPNGHPPAPEDGESETIAEALGSVREAVTRAADIPGDVRRAIETSLDEAEALLSQQTEARLSELSMLRVLASAGTTVVVFNHTLRAMARQLQQIVSRLEVIVSRVPDENLDDFTATVDDLRSWSSMAVAQGSLVGLLVGPEARTRPRSRAVAPLVEELERGFAGYMSRFGISLESAVPATVRTPPLYEAEVYAVLLNLLTNSFRAVREGGPERRVRIEAGATKKEFTIRVHDTGVGVPLESREEVFDPFFTTSQPDPVLGVGTGLGLKIVRDLARAWGGDIRFVDAAAPWRTTAEIVVPNQGVG